MTETQWNGDQVIAPSCGGVLGIPRSLALGRKPCPAPHLIRGLARSFRADRPLLRVPGRRIGSGIFMYALGPARGWLGRGSARALVASLVLALDPPLTRKPFSRRAGFGAAYGTAKSGVGIASMGVLRPDLVIKSIIPVVMAGVLGIYGLIIAVIISTGSEFSVGGCVGAVAGRLGGQMDKYGGGVRGCTCWGRSCLSMRVEGCMPGNKVERLWRASHCGLVFEM